jgi:hypothetical protein
MTRPEISASMISVFTPLTWAAVRPGWDVRSAALMPGIMASEMIRPTALTAAPAYMSMTAVSTGAGVTGRAGAAGAACWPPDGQGWSMVTSFGMPSQPQRQATSVIRIRRPACSRSPLSTAPPAGQSPLTRRAGDIDIS